MDKMEENKAKKSSGKKWVIGIAIFLGLCAVGLGFLYYRNSVRPFNRSEYIKEVIVQNDDFNNLVDKFLDSVSSYNSTQESTEKLEGNAQKITDFVSALKEKLGPRVGDDSKEHYEKMMAAYDKYLEAVDMYKKVVPKGAGEERATLMQDAQAKLMEAQKAMKSL